MLSYRERKRIREEAASAAAVAHPRRGGPWFAALNAPITLWLLSAVTISAFGSFYTNVQACRSDAEKLIERYEKLETETFRMRRSYLLSLLSAKTDEEVMAAIEGGETIGPYVYSEFRFRSRTELGDELHRIEGKLGIGSDLPHAKTIDDMHDVLLDTKFLNKDGSQVEVDDYLGWAGAAREKLDDLGKNHRQKENSYIVARCDFMSVSGRMITGNPAGLGRIEHWPLKDLLGARAD